MLGEARRVALAAVLLVTSEAVHPRPAGAEASESAGPSIDVVGTCPDPADVRTLLKQLVPADEARDAAISIQDKGPNYRIAVRGTATTLADPSRDCPARAQQAAVVVASDLRSHPAVLGPPEWTIEKGLVFDIASTPSGAVWAPGAELRGAYGSGRWSIVGAAGARGPVTLAFEHGWQAELLRFPFDAGARLTMYKWRIRPWVTFGPSLTLTALLGENLVQTDREWRVDLGGLVMVGATLPVWGRIGGAAALSIRWQPRPYQLQVTPVGTVGETPVWWFGLSLNYTVDGKASSP